MNRLSGSVNESRAALPYTSVAPADAMASRVRDNQDGPSGNVPIEMMPVAITKAK